MYIMVATRSFILIVLLTGITPLYSQPMADFEIPNSACRETNILATSTSTNANTFEWDFCLGDFESLATSSDVTNISSNTLKGIELIEDGGQWFGFVVGRSKLFRLNFGNSVSNTPLIDDLGNLSGALSSPEAFVIKKNFNGNWIAFIGHLGVNFGITRLNFGTDLTNTPVTDNIGTPNGGRTRGLALVEDDGSYYLLATVYNSRGISVIDFAGSMEGSVGLANTYNYGTFPDLNLPTGITAVYHNSNWIVYVTSQGNESITRFNFGNDFTSMPIVESHHTLSIGLAKKIRLFREGNNYYGVIGSESNAISIWNFQDLNLSEPIGISQPSLPESFAFSLIDQLSTKCLFTIKDDVLKKFVLKAACDVSSTFALEKNPQFFYGAQGDYDIELKVKDSNGNYDFLVKSINIEPSVAPSIFFNSQNICLTSPIQFNSESDGTGLTYAWDFGDGNNSVLEDPSHTYAAVGEYEVTLSIDNGTCGNFMKQTITIYDEPVPDFTLPGGVICTNQQVFFTNETPGDFDGLISYEWRVDDIIQSTETNFTFEFPSGGDKEVKLIASIPGCNIEIAKNLLDVREGAVSDFSFNDACLGEIVQFNNQSTGAITDYNWDFGNGFISNLEEPSLQYPDEGTFDVTLSLTNSDGCITTESKPITIHPLPDVAFEAELSCENLHTQFNDLTTINLDNLSSWEWDFNEGQGFANDQNTQFVFDQSGNFDVELKVTSTFGCVDSLTQNVTVLPAPESNFELDKICAGVEVNFTDTSVPVDGQSITSWAWSLGGSFTNEQNPSFTFEDPLDYNVSLTVTSENLCTSTIEEVVSIPPVPSVDFTIQNDCENEIALLADNTAIEGDIINQWKWVYNSNVIGTNPEVENDFAEAGDYEVELEIFTENGCVYQGLKSITINSIPTASFSVSASFGAPPLIVDFTNNSINSNAYLWDFGDGNTSDDENPSNSFDFINEYDVELQAISDDGCRDTTSQRVSVLVPEVSLELTSIELVERPQGSRLLLAIRNNGTVTLDSVNVLLDLGGEVILNEKIYPDLGPNQFSAVQLDIQLTNRKLDYICGFITSFLDIEEENMNDNNKCINLNESSIIINQPYPNPSKGEVTFEVITTESEVLTINIIDSNGRSVFKSDITVESGSNNLNLDLSGIKEGLYLLRIGFHDEVRLYRIVITD